MWASIAWKMAVWWGMWFETACERAASYSSAWGVGPMTIAMLMENTLLSAAIRQGVELEF